MPEYKVYYAKHPTFQKFDHINRDLVLGELTHAHIKTVDLPNLSEVYRRFQVLPPEFGVPTVWKPENAVADNRVMDLKGVRHTSMSVGDCVLDSEADVLYECASVGWREVE